MPEPVPRKSEPNTPGMLDELREISELGNIPVSIEAIPVRWTLTDVDGRAIDATIIGKSGASITLIRNSDGKRFDLSVARLSASDQERVKKLADKTSVSRHPLESAHYRMTQAKLDELDARIAEVQAVYNSTDSKIQLRTAVSQMKRLQDERLKLLEDLKELEKY